MSITINGTTGIAGVDGTAAAPSVQGADSNTGVFFPAADTVAVTTGGAERMRVDSSGNVGIGVSNPEDYRDFGPAPALVFGNTTGSSQATIVSGTASEGNLTFADGTTGNDSYRGLIRYNHSSDYMALFTAATERMRIDSSGNVGIGTSSPFNQTTSFVTGKDPTIVSDGSYFGGGLYFDGTWKNTVASQGGWALRNSGGVFTVFTGPANGGVGSAISASERMRIGADGDVQIGTATAAGKLTLSWSSSTQQGLVLRTTAATFAGSPVVFQTSAGATAGFIGQTATPSVSYNTTSDYRLKENVQPMVGALDKIAQLNPVTYTWKSDGSDGQGFIAHELQAVVPDCVSGEKDAVDADGKPQYQGVDTSFLVATLVAAIQALTARIAALEAK